jgi:UDP-N-acetylmuramoyl-tripeptide--D-alanyl-D-alanine ligase
MWSLAEIAARLEGQLVGTSVDFERVVTDSRVDCSGALFVALPGPHYDGNHYVKAAYQAGAVAALVTQPVETVELPYCLVADTYLALQQLAHAWRMQLSSSVFGVTGSNGKTTCKSILATLLQQQGSTQATSGNLNNAIGLPLTILAARNPAYLVLELGANHPGEIATLTAIAQPSRAIITSIGRAHLEGFGDLTGVATAKGEIAQSIPAHGLLIHPAATPWESIWRQQAHHCRRWRFGFERSAEVWIDPQTMTTEWTTSGFATSFQAYVPDHAQPVDLLLPLPGRHNASNAIAACAAALDAGLPVHTLATGLAQVQPNARRLQPKQTPSGLRILDDTYNANPDSLLAGLEVLQQFTAPRVLVLGDCGELGSETHALHDDMGRQARQAGIGRLYALGSLAARAAYAFGAPSQTFTSHDQLVAQLLKDLDNDDLVLVKGSRAAAMERVVDQLLLLKT